MAIDSNISWTDHTWNPARGCHKVYDRHPITGEKVSECEFCYMYRGASGLFAFDAQTVTQTSTKSGGAFNMPLRLPKTPAKVFTASLTDFWHKDLDGYRLDALAIIMKTPHLTYQILTKRPQNIRKALELAYRMAHEQAYLDPTQYELMCWIHDWLNGKTPQNVWLGVSAGYQHTADKRIPILLEVPAACYFVSVEPLLEPVDLTLFLPQLDWVIVGGESGNKTGPYRYRECSLEWIGGIVEDCIAYGVACWVKQLGTHLQDVLQLPTKHATNPAEWPQALQVQQFPIFQPANQ